MKKVKKNKSYQQYTVRMVPPDLDKALRRLARETSVSMNQLILETLRQASILEKESNFYFDDLDHLIGTWQEDPAFNEALNAHEVVDSSEWKLGPKSA